MTHEQETLLLVRAMLAQLPDDQRHKVEAHAEIMRQQLKVGGQEAAMAFALVGAEKAAEE